ncbi:tRNA preQ1(34) S-adenosylmethionine ribosyltransferase-isomerase QueA [Clostridia bacterium]|nr:tRNA preQ1(34) S-adenosylmethionine ribosyltransferase-isomerase QueA [Clostridia bacterium]
MKKNDFFYSLPPERIAQTPAEPRDSSRLLVYDRKTGKTEHRIFRDLPEYLRAGDLLVRNDTRVLNMRLDGRKATGGRVELLLLKRRDLRTWEVLVKPGKNALPGTRAFFFKAARPESPSKENRPTEKENKDRDCELQATVLDKLPGGCRLVRFEYEGVFEDILKRVGGVPLPHYIKKAADPERYNTVYAKTDGSAAAPTAGLHFTPELLQSITDIGARFADITLNVGLGTFRPVKAENIEEHEMHAEFFTLDGETARAVNTAKADGRRVIAVGTTSVRALESAAKNGRRKTEDGKCADNLLEPFEGDTSIFIYPPYEFKIPDALITNFHLPESTLLMLVSAFLSQGGEDGRRIALDLYETAVREGYRFFSFGDAMLIL